MSPGEVWQWTNPKRGGIMLLLERFESRDGAAWRVLMLELDAQWPEDVPGTSTEYLEHSLLAYGGRLA